MAEKHEKQQKDKESNVATAKEHKTNKVSLIWVVPLIALILTGLLIWHNSFNKGPVITILTNSAEGIEKGKTFVKVRSVVVGQVTDVSLTKDYKHTLLTVQMDKDTEDLLRSDSVFWVVKPRIENTGISGLDTLLSGAYLQLKIGTADDYKTDFKVLEEPPVRLGTEKGLMLSLVSTSSKKINVGAMVLFRGFDVGKVTEVFFDIKSQTIRYKLFIRDPYAQLVNKSTKFWINSGVDVRLDESGFALNTESLDNIIAGGIVFDNFSRKPVSLGYVPENSVYQLYHDKDEARISWLEDGVRYVVLLENGLYKLVPGSAITFNGVQIGEVIKAPWFQDSGEVFKSNMLPVLFSINYDSVDPHDISTFIDHELSQHTICAQLASGNLILGNNQIELIIDNTGKCKTQESLKNLKSIVYNEPFLTYEGQKVVPLVPTQALSMQVNQFFQKLNEFDVAGFSTELQTSLKAFSKAMDAFTSSNDAVLQSDVIAKLATAFDNFNASVKSYGPNTPVYEALYENLKRIEQILQDLSPAITEAGQSPNSILFGGEEDPIPQASSK